MKKNSAAKYYAALVAVLVAAAGAYFLHRSFFRYGQRLTEDEEVIRQGADLAGRHCGGCHLVPSPAAHSPRLWSYVLVQMGFRLGLDTYAAHGYFPDDQKALQADRDQFLKSRGPELLSPEDFRKIRNYYLTLSARDFQLVLPARTEALAGATVIPLRIQHAGAFAVTAVLSDRAGAMWLGEGISRRLFRFDSTGTMNAGFSLPDMPVSLQAQGDRLQIAYIGSMFPSDDRKGRVLEYSISGSELTQTRVLAENLYRTANAELQPGGELDVAGFGNTRGEFSVFSGAGAKQVLHDGSGAIWSRRVRLFGHAEQLLVLIAQEKEELVLFEKTAGNWRRVKTLLKFPPEYGSMQFHVTDLNADGRPDILMVNGDDGDLPGEAPRAYHGIRAFLQGADQDFQEKYFFNFPGAYRSCIADFNRDGKADVAAVSYYPAPGPELFSLVVLLGDKQGGFTPHRIATDAKAKFITLDCGDVDRNGIPDLTLGKGDLSPPENKDGTSVIGYFIPNPFGGLR